MQVNQCASTSTSEKVIHRLMGVLPTENVDGVSICITYIYHLVRRFWFEGFEGFEGFEEHIGQSNYPNYNYFAFDVFLEVHLLFQFF
ncbi:hypothetical protein OOA_08497 [Providencia burhodogranariea DSM 19968]|uniref:Uncharacterized protein n=1 Tax=Providencia burhodogranariea DSM 19968 TaxID=1141662 RepID=K8WNX7_9GAMM|nr:hypothetical protein OOA_08497 [Providencia burhodogranariea DSM 19968]